jgi:hypothetical protein
MELFIVLFLGWNDYFQRDFIASPIHLYQGTFHTLLKMRQCTQHLSHQFNGSQLNTSQRMMNRIPKFIDSTAWKQAEILMQPALIRVIDKLGKYLENSSWQGNYQTVTLWPEGTSPKIQKK